MRWLAALAAVLALVLVLALVGVNVAPGLLRPALEAAASRALGRTVTIGALRLEPRWPPVVVATDIRAQGLGGLDRAEADIVPSALLAGRPRIAVLRLLRPELIANAGEVARLLADRPMASSVHAASAPAGAPPAPVLAPPLAPAVARIVIDRGGLRWVDPRGGASLAGTLSGTIDVATHALALRVAIPGGGGVAAATVAADGVVAWPHYDLAVSLRAANQAALAGLLGPAADPPGAITIDAHARGDRSEVGFSGISIASPQGDLAGDLALAFGPHPGLRGHLTARWLDLDALLALLAVRPRPAPAAASGGLSPAPSARVIPDRALPFSALARGAADVTLSVARLRLGGVDYADLAAHVLLRDGRLTIAPFGAALPGGGHLAATLSLDAAAVPPTVALDLHAPSVAIAALLAALQRPGLASGTAVVDASLRASGATLHRLAATLTGTAAMHVTGGALDGPLLDLLLRRAHLPAPRIDGQVAVPCAAVGASATQGVLALSPLVADSARLRLDGAGRVDLGQETMDLPLRALLRTGPGLAFPVHVAGSWRAPAVTLGAGSATPPAADAVACPATAAVAGHKPPKPIDILRGLLR